MKMESKNTSKKISKNQLFKNKVIINYDDLYKKSPSILESENEIIQSKNQHNQIFNSLFDENKFKI